MRPSIRLQLSQKFPTTDRLLTSLPGNPKVANLNDGASATTDSVTNEGKWVILLQKQAALIQPYHTTACKDYAEVMSEVEVYKAADQLAMKALKDVAMNKVNAWFEDGLQSGVPLSNEFRQCASEVVLEHKDFATLLFAICTKYLPVVEGDPALNSLLDAQNPVAWNVMVAVSHQWKEEVKQQQYELETRKNRIWLLTEHTNKQKTVVEGFEQRHKSQVETLSAPLALAESSLVAAENKVSQLQNLNRDLQQELLLQKVSALKMKENNPAPALTKSTGLKSDVSDEKLVMGIDELQRLISGKEFALEQARSAHQRVKDDLRGENEGLRTEISKLKSLINQLVSFFKRGDGCPGCRKRWNVDIGHAPGRCSISVDCKICAYKEPFTGNEI